MRTPEDVLKDIDPKQKQMAELQKQLRHWLRAFALGYKEEEIACFLSLESENTYMCYHRKKRVTIPAHAVIGFKLKDGRKIGFDGLPLPKYPYDMGKREFSTQEPLE